METHIHWVLPDLIAQLPWADSLIHFGDTDTKIRFPAADSISFETGGSERLRINSSGLLVPAGSVVQQDLSVGASQDFKIISS